ncbi:BcsR/BcsP family cellulose biosynthesis protein [Vibrio aphrogenes]|uniref:BcsR/BcsP family cellulose biosynthesis protein n=1 Tax=Vibrio aphrogenes TaxID=1891186 RepID=UPI000B34BC70|nr:BcsR/BcsP family cellulose biosynthesis protein [Vibrio aphrogenes]
MSRELSKDISSLFDAYHVTEPDYKELSEKERYFKAKKKWPALQGFSDFSAGVAADAVQASSHIIETDSGQGKAR